MCNSATLGTAGSRPRGLPYGQMVIAYGTADVQEIVEQPVTPDSNNTIVKLHFDMLRASGYPGDEDELSTLRIEFWITYVEHE
ncbi:Uu.00g099170.m01.CDS01 [Anthostomella pinea]|uniref:Uu.00g099170.m01.CDS01 n=1 Tax=Anthostomella pinea TaxID=933095 RepID=A0AAI8V7N9_9PEZI|nr:Uu.00g099170.m01.CDS01 [Anthostomella pinea]